MTTLCLGALLAGSIAACIIPFLPFAFAVLTAAVLGTAWILVEGGTAGHASASALLLIVAGQVGYGAGVLALALAGHGVSSRRAGRDGLAPPAARPLQTGNEPR